MYVHISFLHRFIEALPINIIGRDVFFLFLLIAQVTILFVPFVIDYTFL